MSMSLPDIKTMIVAGFKSAFLPFHVKQSMLRQISEELERFHDDGKIDMPPATSSKASRSTPIHAEA